MTCAIKHKTPFVGAGVVLAVLLATVISPAAAMSLGEALALAVENDPSIAQALAQYEADREAGAADRASRRPQLNVMGSTEYANTKARGVFTEIEGVGSVEEDYSVWGAQVELRQPLFRLDWTARRARAEALTGVADQALRARRNELFVRVADRYFAVLDAQAEVATLDDEGRAVRRSLEDTRQRYEVELVPRTDLVEAQARDDIAQAQLLSARRALDNARDALGEITGVADAVLPELADDVRFPSLDPDSVDDWVAAALETNPALIQVRQQREVALADRRSSRSARMPEVDFFARAGIDDSSDYSFGQRIDDQRVGVELRLPLYAGGQLAARSREAEAQVRVADNELERVRREIEREVRLRYRAVDSSRSEAEAFARALESARAAQQATANGYEAGTRTITDLLDAASRVASAQRDLSATRHRLLLNTLALKELLGTLEQQDFAQIDALLSQPAAQ